jgi:drug/metabolite transporter (DMT)-like permease
MKQAGRTYGAITLAMIIWSLSFIWFKEANQTFRPITIVFSRLVIAVILLSVFLAITKNFTKIRKEDFRLFAMLAIFEPFFYFLGESFGLGFVSATAGSVIISTIPVVATIGAVVVLKVKLKAVNYAGILISFAGILVFVLNKNGSLTIGIKGLLLLMLAVVSASGYNITLSKLVGRYSPVFIVLVQNVIGAILFLPLFLIFDLKHVISNPFPFLPFLKVAELAFFATCCAFILFAYSVNNMGIAKANAFSNCIPVFTAIFAFILNGEILSLQNIAGMGIVIIGLFMSQINGKRKNTDDALLLTGKTA